LRSAPPRRLDGDTSGGGYQMKAIPWLAGVIGSYVGWYAFARMGFMMGFVGSIIGAAIAGYFGRKWVLENL
jgi:hypothetical protein